MSEISWGWIFSGSSGAGRESLPFWRDGFHQFAFTDLCSSFHLFLELPEFGGEKAGETVVVRDSAEASVGERGGVIGEAGGAEVGEDAEGQIEGSDEESGREAHEAGGDAEVGDEPERVGGEAGDDAGDQGFEVGLGEAVEEEVGYDEIVGFCWGVWGWEGEGAGLVGFEAVEGVGGGCFAVAAEELEHGGAGVDCIGLEVGVLGEELGEEAAVAVAEDEGALLLEETGEGVEAATL
jgi:hypothetical protein